MAVVVEEEAEAAEEEEEVRDLVVDTASLHPSDVSSCCWSFVTPSQAVNRARQLRLPPPPPLPSRPAPALQSMRVPLRLLQVRSSADAVGAKQTDPCTLLTPLRHPADPGQSRSYFLL